MGLAFSRSCGLVLASCFLLCSIETATGTGGMTHEGMYEVDLDSSILHVGSASSVRERILAIESDIVRGKGVASASAALEEAVKELRRGVAIERLSEQPTYADGWLTLAVHAYDECEFSLGRKLAETLKRLLAQQMPECHDSRLEPSMAIRIALPPSLLAALASRAIRCSALDVLDVGAASIQRPLLPLQFPDQPLHLRIGYLSSDFHRHKAGLLRRAMFQEPSPSHPLSIHLFYTGTVEDDYTAQLRRASSSRSFTVLSRQDLGLAASLLNSASLHVLVDLNTHNRGGHTALVSLQPAPVIICYPDYPGTSGMANSALLVTDLIVTPPEMRLFATERLLLLPSSFFVADHASSLPPPPAPHAPRKAPGAGGPARVVCAPNAAGKLDLCGATAVRGALRGWEGELWIGPAHSERARERFARAVGVSSGRVHVMRREKRDAHVERLRGCEVSLDSMSLSAIATGADAVWAGSVLVASPGESFGSRVSASLLLNSGRGAGVCRDADDYAAVGMALVGGAWARAKEGFPWDGSAGLFDEEAWMRGWYAGVRSAYDGATASGGVGIEHCEISSGGWKPSHVVAAAG